MGYLNPLRGVKLAQTSSPDVFPTCMSLISHVAETYREVLVISIPGAGGGLSFPFFLVQVVEQLVLGCASAWGIGVL